MSSKKEPEHAKPPKSGFSRRGFIGGVGIGGGALTTGLLQNEAQAATAPVGPAAVPITLTINGKPMKVTVEPRVTLLDALRHHLDLTGAKRVCDRGTCGACTLLVDGKSVYSCTMLAIDAQGRKIETIEGLPVNNPVSVAFVNHDAQQCGYCTPGFVMAAHAFLKENPKPNEAQVKAGLCGNLCRCGTYMGIREAVVEAGAAIAAKGGSNG